MKTPAKPKPGRRPKPKRRKPGRPAPDGTRPLLQTRIARATMAKLRARVRPEKPIGRVLDEICGPLK